MRARIVAFTALLTGCSGGTGGPPPTGEHAFLLFTPADQARGWTAIDALRRDLPGADRARIRTAGLIASDLPTMYVDIDARCDRDAALLTRAREIVRRAGAGALACSRTLPTAR